MNKTTIIERLKSLLDEKVSIAWNAMQAAQASANEESKSSAGDKYETGRAMAQNERDRYAQQYEILRQERLQLERQELAAHYERVEFGSLIETSEGWFLIAISVGIIPVDTEKVVVISPGSPIGSQLLGKRVGEHFQFRGKSCSIIRIE
ncbi:transcription elongation factor [Siphonobacter sp. BAB-5385]|uniref:GreA/GreB family elongation factor n=1 Tax=Siphonobacter sp. BAB-5385 TaxID=1864822 RepID=UPI000B9E6DD3|nr:GreA/GreB family elongation factor [Siphonobacter sp. BAB-5385]OZI06327.1 transcription elongation factor [Siphonobacter sp. BAB-5385]